MVLKSIVRYIINKYLKDYIEQLDDERLKVDLKHGHVALENLHLKPEALVGVGLPVTVAVGFIEKLTIVIPWKNLHSNPTKVYLEGLYMLVVPKNEVRQDLTEYHAEKMKRVQRKLDNLRKATLDEHKVHEKDQGFFEKMKLQMMQNLQIVLKNFHVSYETQSTTKLGHPFSFGATIHNLQLITTTNHKRIGKIKENTLIIFKITEIHNLSLYWNSDCKSRIHQSFQYVVNDLKSKIATDNFIPSNDDMNYVFYPVNLNLELEVMIKFAEHNFERPIFKVDYKIEQMSFQVDPRQLSDLLDFIKFQNYSVFYDRCREYRILYLRESNPHAKLTQEEQNRIHVLESKLDVYTLAYIRHTIELETHHSSDTNDKNDYSWWNWWWNGNAASHEEHHKPTATQNMNTTEDAFFSEETLGVDVEIKMKRIEFNLLTPRTKQRLARGIETISRITIDNSQIDYKRRAISSSLLLVLDLGYFRIYGLKSDNQHRPILLTSSSKSLYSLIRIEFELAPIDKKSDYRFLISMEPLTIVYHAPTFNEIVSNFEPIDKSITYVSPQIKQRTIKEMEYALSIEKIFDMTIQMKGLRLLLPEYGIYQKNCKTMFVHLSSFILRSCLNNDKEGDQILFKKDMRERRYYVKYQLLLNNFGISYLPSDKERIPLLKAIPLLDTYFYKCIFWDDANLADWRIYVKIAKMSEFKLSKKFFRQLILHHRSVPLFYSVMAEILYRINYFFDIFPPHITAETDIFINKCFFVTMHSKKSLQMDFYSHLERTRHDNEYNKSMTAVLKHLTMKLHPSLISKELFWPFYQKNSIELSYSDTDTKL